MERNLTTEFLDLYKMLEEAIRNKYGDEVGTSPVAWLARNDQGVRGMREELNYCREVRNILQHRRRLEDGYAVVPSEGMVETLRETVAKVERIPSAYDLCVKVRDICSAGPHDRMLPVMRAMAEGGYTHVPIMEDGRVVGAFSENTLLSYLIADEIVEVGEDATLDRVEGLLPLDAHTSETFAFVGRDTLAPDVVALFKDALRRSERLGAVFVTTSGRPTERLLGMLTSWDMAAFF